MTFQGFFRQWFLVTFALFLTAAAFSQKATVRGFVYESETGEPVIFTNVYLQGTTMGASTDVNGYFSITQIPPGDYILTVSYLGYDTLQKRLSLKADQIITEKLFLESSAIEMGAVEISADRQEALNNVQMSVVKITPKEITKIPSVGGTADLAQYLQVLPGVIFTGDQGGQLYIRGGSPIQNKVLLDGMTVYNAFHSIGLFSVFDTEIIRNADIYTGGFGAEYGGRISSVMDITTKDGNKRRTAGNVSLSTFGASAMVEGPIKKQTDTGNGSSSFILSAKHSYLAETSQALYDYVDEDGLPFTFTDLYGKLSFNSSSGSSFELFGFNFQDQVTYQAISNLQWNSFGGGANVVLVPVGSPVLIEGNFSLSDYHIELDEEGFDKPRTSGINNFDLGFDFSYFQGENSIKYGIDISGFGTDFMYYNSVGNQISTEGNNTELAGYFTYKAKIQNLILDLGVRAQYYASIRVLRPEPRFGVKYNLTEKLRLKGAAGLYSQNLIAANSDQDVVNLFYGFLAGPEDLQKTFTLENGEKKDITNSLQKAYHVIAGFEYDLNRNLNINIEGYYKNFNQLSNLNRNKIFDQSNIDADPMLRNNFIIESGEARGVDVTVKYELEKFYFWAVYSLTDVDRWDGTRTYDPIFDRRHNVNLLASYEFGKNWEVNGRWNYGSGFPFTQNQGAYLKETFANGINTDITQTNADYVTLQYGPLNQGRLPDYHRFDLTVKKTFEFSRESSLECSVSVTNIYNRENIFYVNRISGEEVYQLPILPSAGITYTF